MIHRRRFIKLATLATGGGLAGYGSLIERRSLDIVRVDCPLAERFRHLDGYKVALLSDFHFDDWGDANLVAAAVQAANDFNPDVIIMPGDFVSHDSAEVEPLTEILSDLKSANGVFGVLGNHDFDSGPKSVTKTLEKGGVHVLRGETSDLGDVVIAGFDSATRRRADFEILNPDQTGGKPVIAGWHEPDAFDWVSKRPDLVLQVSGHTHGGQVRIPGLKPVILPNMGRKYVEGLYQKDDSSLYVTRGIGAMGIPIRFNCPPEATLITLRG